MNTLEVKTLAETLKDAYREAWGPITTQEHDWQAVAQAAQSWFDAQRAETLKQREGKSLAQVAWEAVGSVEAMTPTTLSRYTRIATAVESAVLARIDSGRKVTVEEFQKRTFAIGLNHCSTPEHAAIIGNKLATLFREYCPVAAESKPTYFVTAERPPTAEDGKYVLVWHPRIHSWLQASTDGLESEFFPYWMPQPDPPAAPPVSEDEKALRAAISKKVEHAPNAPASEMDGFVEGWYAALAHARREQAKGGKAE